MRKHPGLPSTKLGAVKLFLGAVIGLILLKAVVGWLTGSISVIAQAADSLLDLISGIAAYSAIRIATTPADEEHPYGHGKAEDLGGLAQGLLIFSASALIIYSSARRIMEGSRVEFALAGSGVMLVSIVVSIVLSRYIRKVARATASITLEANARNIAADVYSALAVLVGLLIVFLTGISFIDSIVAIGVALYILRIAYITIAESLSGLIDTRLDIAQEAVIKAILKEHGQQVVSFHKLRTRRVGRQPYIDLHMVVAKDISVERAHEISEHIEEEIRNRLPDASVITHIEPCNDDCEGCAIVCSIRRTNSQWG